MGCGAADAAGDHPSPGIPAARGGGPTPRLWPSIGERLGEALVQNSSVRERPTPAGESVPPPQSALAAALLAFKGGDGIPCAGRRSPSAALRRLAGLRQRAEVSPTGPGIATKAHGSGREVRRAAAPRPLIARPPPAAAIRAIRRAKARIAASARPRWCRQAGA